MNNQALYDKIEIVEIEIICYYFFTNKLQPGRIKMSTVTAALISDPEMKTEIERYKWAKNEILGSDISFDAAAEEWVKRFSKTWFKLRSDNKHLPFRKIIKTKAGYL